MNFAVPAGYRVKLKERKKKKTDKSLHLVRELKYLRNMQVTMKSIVIGALGTIPKDLVGGLEEMEIRGIAETTQATALLKSARIIAVT